MQTGFYCVVQFQPDSFRREGVNVGVIVVAEQDRDMRLRFAQTYERARRMFPGFPIDDQRLAAAFRALQRRILEVERTEEGVRGFIRKESSQLVIFPPLRACIEDIDATLDRIFKEFVADPRPAPRVTCPMCSFSFDPAASTAGPAIARAQVLKSLPLPPLRPAIASVPQPLLGAERWGDMRFPGAYAASTLRWRSRDAASTLQMEMERSVQPPFPASRAVPGDRLQSSNVLPNKERWS
jgi:Protein of unknown function (DUF3037)